jgi:MATE family multidrug resistance protein
MNWLTQRWRGDGGMRQLLNVAFPLIMSTGSYSVMMFVDRMFLSWYSEEAIAASVPASMLNFSFLTFFMGTVMYTSTFVAQYFGARRPDRIGMCIWQGLRLALIGGAMLPLLNLAAPTLFDWVGHDLEVRKLEIAYFRILNFVPMFSLISSTFSCFYSGRGRTWPVMWMSISMCTLNGFLDYGLVLGNWGMPRLGILGAGYTTLISSAVSVLIYGFLVFRPVNDRKFGTRRNWRFEKTLFLRIVRFGAPSGFQFWLSITGFAVFVLLIGRIGKFELVASNMAQQVNMLGILPMVGIGMATTILVGRFQGAGRSDLAVRATLTALSLSFAYSICMAVFYTTLPGLLLSPFTMGEAGVATTAITDLATGIMRFMAVALVVDSMTIVLGGSLKGSGDTRFVMVVNAITSAFCLVLPTFLVIEIFRLSIYAAFMVIIFNLCTIAAAFLIRFRGDRWKAIRVIEEAKS